MSNRPQLDPSPIDLHPDAESLSAWAGGALPEHERESLVAHLARCPRCRAILFLAQEADGGANREPERGAEASAPPIPAGPFLLPHRNKPRAHWSYAWGALAACGVLAAASALLYPHRPVPAPQQAGVQQVPRGSAVPSASPSKSSAAFPSKSPAAEAKEGLKQARGGAGVGVGPASKSASVSASVSASKAAPEAEVSPTPAPTVAAAQAMPAGKASAPAPARQEAAASASTRLDITLKPAQASQTVSVSSENAQIQPQTESEPLSDTISVQRLQPEDQVPLKGRSFKARQAAHAAMRGAAQGAGPGNGVGQGAAGSVGSAAAGSPADGAASPPAAFAKGSLRTAASDAQKQAQDRAREQAQAQAEDRAAAANAVGKTLPSGLPAMATVAADHHLLALDSGGALFLSEDGGAVWEPIAAQWSGRAAVLLVQTAGADQAARAPADFELITADGVHWTSPDGRKWERK